VSGIQVWRFIVPLLAIAHLTAAKAAIARNLDYWKFDIQQNRLEIITDRDVRPQAVMLANPTRVVIDLPGIVFRQPTVREAIGHYVKEVRVGQLENTTTRLVVELADRYSMRPWEVKIRSLAPNRWYVQLSEFQPLAVYAVPPDRAPVTIAVPEPSPYPKIRAVVLIDPGHGGRDPGAIGLRGIQEKQIVLAISQEVARILQQQGINAVLTRADDRFISLEGRVQRAEQVNANVFVSIHANSIGGNKREVNGLETYYFDSGYGLARSIHQSILRRIQLTDRGIRRARFYVLRKSSMPSTLVEVGFVTGSSDSQRLADPSYRRRMAEAIAQGIMDYLR
jgi:N-acetylmuramoyl-L-alanine amidase